MSSVSQVDAAASCQNLTGSVSEHCVAVGYSQTAMSVVCGGAYAEDPHCGTFLEMHMGYSNSYVDAEEVISEVRLTTENVTVSACALLVLVVHIISSRTKTTGYGKVGKLLVLELKSAIHLRLPTCLFSNIITCTETTH